MCCLEQQLGKDITAFCLQYFLFFLFVISINKRFNIFVFYFAMTGD